MACSSYLSRHGSQYSRYTIFWPLFSWNCTVCSRSVFIQLWNCTKTCFCEPGIWGLIGKEVPFWSKSWIVAASNLPEKHTCSIFFFITTRTLVMILNFLKWNGCFWLLAEKSSESTLTPNKSNKKYGSQPSQNTLPWPLLSSNGTVFPRSVFTELLNSQETCFCEPGNSDLIVKAVFY